MDNSADKNRRRYFRVKDTLFLSVVPVDKEKLQEKAREINQKHTIISVDEQKEVKPLTFGAEDFKDPGLLYIAEMLDRIDRKLDTLIGQELSGQFQEEYGRPVCVDISAGGMRFAWNDALEEGSFVHMAILLNKTPSQRIDALGKVLRRESNMDTDNWGEDKYLIAVEFIELSLSVFEMLVSYVFSIQRSQLRRNRMENQS